MSSSTPEALAERWVPGTGPVTLNPLASGLVNASYRVGRDGRLYSLRVAAPDVADLGQERGWECRILRLAAEAELAPRLYECSPRHGVVVADWIDGRVWTPDELRLPVHVEAMAALLRRVHALPIPRPARVMSPAGWIAHYAACATRRGELSPAAGALRDDAGQCLRDLGAHEAPEPVLCHSDLHRLNVLVRETRRAPLLLDWEYAHVSDGFWDLAGWVANNDWAEDDAVRLLGCYLGRTPREAEAIRLRLLCWLYDYVCVLWSEVYVSQRPAGNAAAVLARAGCIAARLSRGTSGRACR